MIQTVINQPIMIWTSETKSLLPSLYKREELPLFGKEGEGRFSEAYVFFNMDSLVILEIEILDLFRASIFGFRI
jgi:hypothetical protein